MWKIPGVGVANSGLHHAKTIVVSFKPRIFLRLPLPKWSCLSLPHKLLAGKVGPTKWFSTQVACQ